MLHTVLFIVTIASVIYNGASSSSDSSGSSRSSSDSSDGNGGGYNGNGKDGEHGEDGASGNSGYNGKDSYDGKGYDGKGPFDNDKACDYTFTNSDFYDGTFRIRRSGKYCFGENIILNPRSGDIDNPNKYGSWFPVNEKAFPGSIRHDDGGWALGFFSAISIEVSNVELDLKGFEISMSKPFYIQQRWFNHIEIQNAAFNFNQGPANFGQTIPKIRNVHIKNGRLGRSAHNGLHAFDVENVCIEDLKIFDFEVCGLQFNGFRGVTIKNVDIGPSAQDVPFWGYYSHGRFSLNGFELIDDTKNKWVRFNDGRQLTVHQIYSNLRESMNIAYRWEMGELTDDDKNHPLYKISLEMFRNPFRIPDGSAIYGMLFNSKGLATQGFGDSDNLNDEQGNMLYVENVNIDGLIINMNEIPTLHFDRCEGFYFNDDGTTSITPIFGRFGDTFDVRRALQYDDWNKIDMGFGDRNNGYSYGDIKYYGNPLSDAQIALNIFSPPFISTWGLRSEPDNNRGKQTFIQWATDSGYKYDSLPNCARFICNADAMFHTNKGIVGIRLDGIENAVFKNIKIKNLYNESPLASMACNRYLGPFDGGHPAGLQREGVMGTDIRAISIINGGGVEIMDDFIIDTGISSYGDVIGIHLMDNAQIYINGDGLKINNLQSGAQISYLLYTKLINDGLIPYPNNLYHCNIKAEQLRDRKYESYPYDYKEGMIDHSGNGYIYPKNKIIAQCQELYFDQDTQEKKRRLF